MSENLPSPLATVLLAIVSSSVGAAVASITDGGPLPQLAAAVASGFVAALLLLLMWAAFCGLFLSDWERDTIRHEPWRADELMWVAEQRAKSAALWVVATVIAALAAYGLFFAGAWQ